MDPLSLAASVAGLISLAGATLSITKTFIHDAKHGKETAQEFLQELDVLHFNLARLDNFLRSESDAIGYFNDTSVLVSSTHSCKNRLDALHARLIETKERRLSLHTLTWPFKVKEHRDMIAELRAFAHWVQFALTINGCNLLAKTSVDVVEILRKQLESFQLLQRVDDRTSVITEHTSVITQAQLEQSRAMKFAQIDGERTKILNWISTVNHQQKHHDISKPRVAGTGEWLLREAEFTRWIDISQPLNVLWCSGIQGSGKTILTYEDEWSRWSSVAADETQVIGH